MACLRAFGHRCLMCGAEGVQLTCDHVQPRSAGGKRNGTGNVQPLCSDCNSAKWCLWIDFRMTPPMWNDHGEWSEWTPRHTEILFTRYPTLMDRMWRLRALSAGWEVPRTMERDASG
jgi:hypothetical protein